MLAEVDGHPVAVRQGNVLAVAFHPELSGETRLHEWLLAASERDGVRDQRADALAQILVRYSTKVQKGDVCVIQGSSTAEPLVQAVYEEVLRAGGLPIMQLTTEEAAAAFYELASDEQLDWVPPTAEWAAENADVRIAIMADANTRDLSQADPKKQARAQKARKPLMETSMRRSAAGEYRWALTLFPTHAYASEAGHVAGRVRGLLLRRLPGHRRRPGHRLAAPVGRGQAPGRVDRGQGGGAHPGPRAPTSSSAWPGATGSPASASTTCPTASSSPARSRTRSRARSRSRSPRPTAAARSPACAFASRAARSWTPRPSAARTFLHEMLDTDEGARRLGELGIGTNYGITTGTKEILLDEKIGGTVHMAIGMSYPETGGTNDSAVHWDMVLRPAPGRLDHRRRRRAPARRQVRRLRWPVTRSGRRSSTRRRPPTPSAGQLFTKLGRAIQVAAREGGGDPTGNPALANAIQKAKEARMPKDNIERAMAKGTGAGADADALESVTYEGYGPGGVALLVEAVTDNRNRTGSEVRHALSEPWRQPRRARLRVLDLREEGRDRGGRHALLRGRAHARDRRRR